MPLTPTYNFKQIYTYEYFYIFPIMSQALIKPVTSQETCQILVETELMANSANYLYLFVTTE
jgi:hypothetical protein